MDYEVGHQPLDVQAMLNLRPVHMGLVIDRVAQGQVFL